MRNAGGKPLRAVVLLTLANGLNAFFAFVVAVVAARLLTPHDFGKLSLLMATSLFLSLTFDFGINQILTSRVTLRRDTRLFRDVLRFRSRIAFALTAVAGLACLLLSAGRLKLIEDQDFVLLLIVSAAWQLVFSTEQAFVQGLKNFPRMAVQIIALNSMRLLCVVVFGRSEANLPFLASAYLLPSVLAGGLTAWRRRVLSAGSDFRLLRRILPLVALAGIAVALTATMSRMGLWMVSLLAGSAAAGSYAVAYQMSSLVLVLGSAVGMYFLPRITQIDGNGESYAFFTSYLRKAVPATLLMIALAAVFSQFSPHIFGEKYQGTRLVSFLLMVSFLLSVLNSPFYLFQQSRRRYALLIKVHCGQILLLTAGCLALVPSLGCAGAATADLCMRLLTILFLMVAGLLETRRESSGMNPVPSPATAGLGGRACEPK